MNSDHWINASASVQLRVSRPTNQLDEVINFYHHGLGMEVILQFEKDAWGYSGLVLTMPGCSTHLEFTSHENGFLVKQVISPSSDHLLVFYMPDDTIYVP